MSTTTRFCKVIRKLSIFLAVKKKTTKNNLIWSFDYLRSLHYIATISERLEFGINLIGE